MTSLKERIVDLIEALGPISVSEYFSLCLSDPTHGYYMMRDPFGRDGDFTTAPEISQMFGEAIGVWLVLAWRALGRPEQPLLAEIGPGRGTLAKDIARTLDRLEPTLRSSARFHLIETSPKLNLLQATTLEGTGGRFDWVRSVDELPDGPLLIVGNELFDAIPMRQYVKVGGAWRERMIGLDNDDRLIFVAGAGSLEPSLLPPGADAAEDGAIFEIAPARAALMQKIAEWIAKKGGAGLFIDYGHLAPGLGDTLQAVRKHQPEDVLENPGEADLTSHVDFSALAATARAAGLDAHLTTQGDFLLKLGLLERAGVLGADADEAKRDEIRAAVDRLAGPDQMGELFKVLAILPCGVPARPFGGG
ncbi:class I SAM-dependent methyltransferase [Mesorhizobium sp. LHD-90]|uniref:class I SAM-dependent methyltransferase n=1 Tax=Mesorhizobium sp. LHD-90 TaxID=3071414 RepID=UPI0027DF9358|nr:class I SAM-dependent methyltransferase [Mesorhizobium sp. LHD-90]MDQ6436692.1 class I SAM-dependent methyltransferase [Mesorhizobium sp. LHD-90]